MTLRILKDRVFKHVSSNPETPSKSSNNHHNQPTKQLTIDNQQSTINNQQSTTNNQHQHHGKIINPQAQTITTTQQQP